MTDSERRGDRQSIPVGCPTCSGPLRLVRGGAGIACERGHAFDVEDAAVGLDLISARALWHAVNALRDRAAMSRWQADNPQLRSRNARDPESLRRSAEQDDEVAELLRLQAQQLDRTVEHGRRSG
jgi:hypothetical protein